MRHLRPYISQNFTDDSLESYTIEDFRKFADTVELDKLSFLKEGVEMNLAVSKAGEKLPWGKSMETLAEKGYMGDSLLLNVQRITSCASFARMSGVQLPVMTTTGSGNQGITLILTVAATAMELGVPEEKMLRAIAFAQAINLYAKHYLGTLSCLCSCSVASGLSASAGIVYMMGGSDQQVLDTMRNVLGSISGMICDGAKEGCASQGLFVYRAVCYVSHDGAQWHEYQGGRWHSRRQSKRFVYQFGEYRQCRNGSGQCRYRRYHVEKIEQSIKRDDLYIPFY